MFIPGFQILFHSFLYFPMTSRYLSCMFKDMSTLYLYIYIYVCVFVCIVLTSSGVFLGSPTDNQRCQQSVHMSSLLFRRFPMLSCSARWCSSVVHRLPTFPQFELHLGQCCKEQAHLFTWLLDSYCVNPLENSVNHSCDGWVSGD